MPLSIYLRSLVHLDFSFLLDGRIGNLNRVMQTATKTTKIASSIDESKLESLLPYVLATSALEEGPLPLA